MADPAPPEIIAALMSNVALCQNDLDRAVAAGKGVVDSDDLNKLSRALNDAKVRLEWAKVGVPL